MQCNAMQCNAMQIEIELDDAWLTSCETYSYQIMKFCCNSFFNIPQTESSESTVKYIVILLLFLNSRIVRAENSKEISVYS